MPINSIEKNPIEIFNVSKFYGDTPVLNEVSFALKPGTICGFIGPNGAGKSTTINILARLVLPSTGEAFIEGKSVADDPNFNENVGLVSAEPHFLPVSVEKYVEVIGELRDIPEEETKSMFTASPLFEHRNKQCSELSTGWKKMLQVFVLSLYKPQIFIMDEPFNGLDPTFRKLLFDKLKELRDRGWSILLSTHILSDLQELADNIIMINYGRIVYSGPKTANIQKTYEEYFFRANEKTFSF